ncbi:MAG TPA: hypothetical protein VGE76_20430, partial [Opitutaceae bacterium]
TILLRAESLRVALQSERETVTRNKKSGLDEMVARSPQPGLLMALLGQMFRLAESISRKTRPSDRALGDMVVLFKVLIDEIDRVGRR